MNWILENWGFDLGVSGSFLWCKKACLCKFAFFPLLDCIRYCCFALRLIVHIGGTHYVNAKMPQRSESQTQDVVHL